MSRRLPARCEHEQESERALPLRRFAGARERAAELHLHARDLDVVGAVLLEAQRERLLELREAGCALALLEEQRAVLDPQIGALRTGRRGDRFDLRERRRVTLERSLDVTFRSRDVSEQAEHERATARRRSRIASRQLPAALERGARLIEIAGAQREAPEVTQRQTQLGRVGAARASVDRDGTLEQRARLVGLPQRLAQDGEQARRPATAGLSAPSDSTRHASAVS